MLGILCVIFIELQIIRSTHMKYKVEKILDGYSICFRQWEAAHSHCHFLHGYAIYFKLYFESEQLDSYNWVWDFAWMKHPDNKIDGLQVKDWFSYMFDHTVIVAEDDPKIAEFKRLGEQGVIQLRTLPVLSCERIAAYVLNQVGKLVSEQTQGRVMLRRVDVFEHNKNCASAEIG